MKKIIPFLVFCLVATCNAELRTWTAVNGKEVEAELVSNSDGQVTLKLKSGKVFKVPLNKLSKADQEFLNLEFVQDDQKPPTVAELLAAMGTPLNKFEKIIADKKYLEKFVTKTGDPKSYHGFEPAENINRTNRTYSILYIQDGVKTLVHGIWMIKSNNLYYMELVADGIKIPDEEREVYKAKIITLDKEKSFFSLPPIEEEDLKEEQISWELIEKFTSVEMQKFNDETTNKNFDIFNNKKPVTEKLDGQLIDRTKPKPEGVSVEELEPRERLVYRTGSDVPYTGKSFELYPNGNLEEVYTFKDGIPNGLMTKWYMNGQKEAEVNFKDGKPDGLVVEWYETGEKMSEVTYKDGRPVDGSEKYFEKD